MPTQDPRSAVRAGARRLAEHPLHGVVTDLPSLRVFLAHHVACVLDFMTLLKRLQGALSCTSTPWVPTEDPTLARLVNSMVLDEEADDAFGHEPASHYEWYLAAMEQVGADTGPIRTLESRLRSGVPPLEALEGCGLPPAAQAFSRTTFELAAGPPHVVAAAFVHGREDLIPDLFRGLLASLHEEGTPCPLLLRYFERHVQIDSGEHGPAAREMLDRLVGKDPLRSAQAAQAAARAVRARESLWDAIAAACRPSAALLGRDSGESPAGLFGSVPS